MKPSSASKAARSVLSIAVWGLLAVLGDRHGLWQDVFKGLASQAITPWILADWLTAILVLMGLLILRRFFALPDKLHP